MPKPDEAADKCFGAGPIGSCREPNHNAPRRCQNIAAIRKARRKIEHGFEHVAQGGGDFGRFAGAACRAGVQQDRAFGKDERGVFDEDRVGERFECRQDSHLDAGIAQYRDIGIMLGLNGFIGRAATLLGAQAVDHRARRLADDGGVEPIN